MRRIKEKYSDTIADKKVVCLYISDDYDFMDRELVDIHRNCVCNYISLKYKFQIERVVGDTISKMGVLYGKNKGN